MKLKPSLLALLGCTIAASPLLAGQQIAPGPDGKDKKVVIPEEKRTWFPDEPLGLITVGGLFSEHLSGVQVDSITALWANRERTSFLFLDSKYRYEDNGEFLQSTGVAFRKRLGEREAIIGINAFYDDINSERDNDFRSLGFGAELLTRYVDARFNYYLPEDKQFEVDRFNKREVYTDFGPGFVRETSRRRSYKTFEAPLEGFDAELGFLVPGLDKYAEVRLFGGYFHYNNPYGSDYEGFKARLEARLLPGVIADVEYYDDAYVLGGHWAAGVRVSVPFSFYNLATGRNPFEGLGDQFRPGPRQFQDRMSEMIIRSPRISTTTGTGEKTRDTTDRRTTVFAPAPGGGAAPLGVPFE